MHLSFDFSDSSFCKLSGFISFYSFPKIESGQSGVSNYYKRDTSIPNNTSYQFKNGHDDEGIVKEDSISFQLASYLYKKYARK